MNLFTKQKQTTDLENKLIDSYQRGKGVERRINKQWD